MLTEQQKNYLSMLLVGDALTQDEIRRFLARSGWTIDQIDAGIALADSLKKKESATGNTVEIKTGNISLPPSQAAVVNSGSTSPVITSKSYNEPISQSDLEPASVKTPDIGYLSPNQPSNLTKRMPVSDMKVPLMQTMPEIPKTSPAKQILSFVAWLLFVVFILMILGLAGYMYHMHLGPFANLTYTSLF